MPLGFQLAFCATKFNGWTGLRRIFSAVFPQEGWSHFIKQLLNASTVLQGLVEHRHHCLGHVETPAASFLGESQQVVGMLLAAGARRAVGPDTRFIDQGQRTFERRP